MWRPDRFVHRRIPLVMGMRAHARKRNDSVIAAIAEVIRDAISAEAEAGGGESGSSGRRMESDIRNDV